MSETPETSQSTTGPYVAMADAGLALTAWSAVFRDTLLVKVPGGDAGGDGGEGDGEGAGGGGLGDGEIVETIEMPLGNELALYVGTLKGVSIVSVMRVLRKALAPIDLSVAASDRSRPVSLVLRKAFFPIVLTAAPNLS
eukprot:scaffold120287_cov55-Phaeocystis_antarctica.AAC.3